MTQSPTDDDVKEALDRIERIAFDLPPPNIYTPELVSIVQYLRATQPRNDVQGEVVDRAVKLIQDTMDGALRLIGADDGYLCVSMKEAVNISEALTLLTRKEPT